MREREHGIKQSLVEYSQFVTAVAYFTENIRQTSLSGDWNSQQADDHDENSTVHHPF